MKIEVWGIEGFFWGVGGVVAKGSHGSKGWSQWYGWAGKKKKSGVFIS